MGSTSSQELTYRVVDKKGTITISQNILQNYQVQEQTDHDLIKEQFQIFQNEAIIDIEIRQILDHLSEKEKWKISSYHQEQKIELEKEPQYVPGLIFDALQKIMNKTTILNIQDLTRYLQNGRSDIWEEFISYNGCHKILELIDQFETNSKNQKKFMILVELLKLLLVVQQNHFGKIDLLKQPNFLKLIIYNIHPVQIEITSIVIELLVGPNGFLWSNQSCLVPTLQIFKSLKEQDHEKTSFSILLEYIFESENLLYINKIIFLIKQIFESIYDEKKKDLYLQELINTKLKSLQARQILEILNEKILKKQFHIAQCTFEDVLKQLQKKKTNDHAGHNHEQSHNSFKPQMNNLQIYFKKAVEPTQLRKSTNQDQESLINLNESQQLIKNSQKQGNQIYLQSTDFHKFDEICTETSNLLVELIQHLKNFELNIQKIKQLTNQQQVVFEQDYQTLIQESKEKNTFQFIQQIISQLIDINKSQSSIIDLQNILNFTQKLLTDKNEEIEVNQYSQNLKDLEQQLQKVKQEKDSVIQALQNDLNNKTEAYSLLKRDFESYKSQEQQNLQQNRDLKNENDQLNKNLKELNEKLETLKTQQQTTVQQNQIAPPPPPPPAQNVVLPPPPCVPPPLPPNLIGVPPPPPQIQGPPVPPGGQLIPPPPPSGVSGPPGAPPCPPGVISGPPGAPPCPPGLPGSSGMPFPPPMPGAPGLPKLPGQQTQNQIPQKIKKTPRVPVKNLMWTILNYNQINQSIWKEVKDEQIELDIDYLEKDFSKVQVAQAVPGQKPMEQSKQIVQKLSLISSERSKNIELILNKLKIQNDVLVNSLYDCNPKILSLGNLESINNILPTDEEVQLLKSFDGDKELLANADKFCLAISSVKGYSFRIKALIFQKTYEDNLKDLEQKIEDLTKFFVIIQHDKLIKCLFEFTLAVGNYLNGSTPRGGAWGFKIDQFDKVAELKTSDGKSNLLAYIVTQVQEINGGVLVEEDDMYYFELFSKLPIGQIQIDINELKKGIKDMVRAADFVSSNEDKIAETLKNDIKKLQDGIDVFDVQYSSLCKSYDNLCQYLCENPKDSSEKVGEKLFKIFKLVLKQEQDNAQKKDKENRTSAKQLENSVIIKGNSQPMNQFVMDPSLLKNSLGNLKKN